MRKLVQSDKAIKVLSDPKRATDLRRAIIKEKSGDSGSGESGSIKVVRVAKQ